MGIVIDDKLCQGHDCLGLLCRHIPAVAVGGYALVLHCSKLQRARRTRRWALGVCREYLSVVIKNSVLDAVMPSAVSPDIWSSVS